MPRARDRESNPSGSAGLPLKTRHYYILLSLSAGDRHGLGVARDVHDLSDGQLRLWPATLYGSLDELLQHGWIEEIDGRRGHLADESEKKRFYRLTRTGRPVVEAAPTRLAELVRVARGRLKPHTGGSL
jgi:DNA-binding PadR family transcriptional regulator